MTPTSIEHHHIEKSDLQKVTLVRKRSEFHPTEKGELAEPIQAEESPAGE
jgi:hypothetical protein